MAYHYYYISGEVDSVQVSTTACTLKGFLFSQNNEGVLQVFDAASSETAGSVNLAMYITGVPDQPALLPMDVEFENGINVSTSGQACTLFYE